MRAERIKYTKYFREADEWIGVEVIVDDGEDVRAAFMGSKLMVDDAYANFRSHGTVSVIDANANVPTGNLTKDIMGCTDTKVLESYRFIVALKGNEQAAIAYSIMMDKLSPSEDKL